MKRLDCQREVGSSSSARSRVGFFPRLLLCSLFAMHAFGDASGQNFDADFEKLSREARGARKTGDLETVEQVRGKRLTLVKAAAKAGVASPVVVGYQAIKRVDGSFKDPGLIDQLKYDDAIVLLRDSWNAMIKSAPQGPVLGEVACRLFEAVHQRKAFYPPSEEEKPVVPDGELITILETAERLDPCCIAAIPMIAWIKPLDVKETFLRAEVRPSLKERQKQLLEISHPLFWSAGKEDKRENNPPNNDKPKNPPNTDKPVMPWHAPVEFAKARVLQTLIDETDTLDPVLSNWFRPSANCMIPRTALRGRDAAGNMAELLYGRMLITSLVDKKGRRRSAAFCCHATGEWSKSFLEILWREPTDADLADARLTRLKRLMDQLETVATWDLNGTTFRLCAWPVHNTEILLQEGVRVLCVKDAMRFSQMRHSTSSNDLSAVFNEVRVAHVAGGGLIRSDPTLMQGIFEVVLSRDKTRNPLLELTGRNVAGVYNNAIALASYDPRPGGPALFDEDEKPPYIQLNDGGKLFFRMNGPGAPCAERVTPFGSLVMPLHFVAVPEPIIAGSGLGQCMTTILRQAGFTNREASKAVHAYVASYGLEVPDKFERWVQAKAIAIVTGGTSNGPQSQRNQPATKLTPQARKEAIDDVLTELTDSARDQVLGVKSDWSFNGEVFWVDQLYGFRHFKDPRGNLAISSEVASAAYLKWLPQPPNPKKSGKSPPPSKSQNAPSKPLPVYTFIDPGGEIIPATQFYTVDEYTQLKNNIYEEHLAKALLFSPSFGTYGAILDDEAHPFLAPDDRMPKYLRQAASPPGNTAGNSGNGNAAQGAAGRSATVYPHLQQPIAAWELNEGKDQVETLRNIHNEYVVLFGKAGTRFNDLSKVLFEAKEKGVAESDALSAFGERVRGLLAVQIQSARGHSRGRNYHHAIVYYNDLLRVLRPPEFAEPYKELLKRIPTTEQSGRFVANLGSQVTASSLVLTLQTELAATLLNAGRADTAYALLSRTVLDYERLIRPSLAKTEELLNSYGVVLPPDYEKSVRYLDTLVQYCREIMAQHDLKLEWRKIPAAGIEAIAADLKRTRDLAELLAKNESASGEKFSKEDSQKLENLIREDRKPSAAGFRFWLERKKILADFPRIGRRAPVSAAYDVRMAMPRRFDKTSGFEDRDVAGQRLIDSVVCDDVLKWCGLPWDAAMAAKDAADNTIVIAWFWMDQGDNARTREALVQLGAICDKRATDAGPESVAGLVSRIDAYRAYACANCFSQRYPGAAVSRVDFTDALEIQVLLWEREWGAKALTPSFANRQAGDVYRMIEDAGAAALNDVETVMGRYFFPDYRFEYGSIPEYIIKDVLENDGALKQMVLAKAKKDEVKAGDGGVPAVRKEDDEWPLVTEEDAKAYFGTIPLMGEPDLKVLGVRKAAADGP